MDSYILLSIPVLIWLFGIILIDILTPDNDYEGFNMILLVFWPVTVLLYIIIRIIQMILSVPIMAWNALKAFDQWLIKRVWGF